ncbi:DUF6789 family protein [Halomarina oriensis]|uniref:Uncharacterized protein n=1 Tax=Halomarina oriensis TaxID=671145 RepID=A0A6B0GMG6_9EURY|nr:DUF6789 family protein [Halomarina oriensis]MWG34857.1 hypothetical protein [Halomarina oriensis]
MDRVPSVVAGGIAGTAVLSLLLILLEVQTREQILVFDVIARFVGVPDQQAVGFVVFLLAGCVAWPLVFVAVEQYIPGGPDPAARGVVLAIPLWIAFDIAGRGDIAGPLLLVYVALTFVAHVAYGWVMGAVYAHLHSGTELPREEYSYG